MFGPKMTNRFDIYIGSHRQATITLFNDGHITVKVLQAEVNREELQEICEAYFPNARIEGIKKAGWSWVADLKTVAPEDDTEEDPIAAPRWRRVTE